jgi:hypothetical protein
MEKRGGGRDVRGRRALWGVAKEKGKETERNSRFKIS